MNTVAAFVLVLGGGLAAGALVSVWYKATARGYALHSRTRELEAQAADMRKRKNEAYMERSHVLALMVAALQDAGATGDTIHDVHKWRVFRGYDEHFKGWGNALYIEAPEATGLGQMCWHFQDDLAYLVDLLCPPPHPLGWDGTTTAQKYERIRKYVAGHGMDGPDE